MAFTSVPFTGTLAINPMDFSWCSVSPTKAFIIYTGQTGGNPNTRKLFIQAVYFNGKAAPTYGPACAVGNLSYTAYLQLSIVSITDGRLVVTMQEDASTFSYSVYNVDASDQVSLSFKHPTLYSQASNIAVPLAQLNNNKVLSCYLANMSSNTFHVLTIGDSTLTTTNVGAGTLYAHTYANISLNNPTNALTGHSIKRDRAGNICVARALNGTNYSSYLTHCVALTTFTKDGVAQYFGQFEASVVGGLDNLGGQKGREVIPILTNTCLSLGATDTSGNGSYAGINTFVKLTLSTTPDARVSPAAPIPYRDTAGVLFHDAIWLDQDYFFALATTGGTSYSGARSGANWTTISSEFKSEVAYIGKYNVDSNSIVMSDNMPLALPTNAYHASPVSNYLHRISNTEVAILQVTRPVSGVFELNITVVGA